MDATEAQQIALKRLKSERNFIEFPFFALSNRDASRRRQTEVAVSFSRNGNTYQGQAQILRSEGYSYPTPFDKRVHKAIEYLITQRGLPVENPFYFSTYEILKLLGLRTNSGANVAKVREAVERITATTIRAKRVVYNKRKESIERGDIFRIFSNYSYVKRGEKEDGETQHNFIELSSWYLDNLNNNYVKPLDFEYFKSLQNDIAGRLYELVGLSFYGILSNRGRGQWPESYAKYDYLKLCHQLPVVPQKYLSKAQSYLAPAHEVLTKTGFFRKVLWEQTGKGWIIKYFVGRRAIEEHIQNQQLQSEAVKQLDLSFGEKKRLEVGNQPKILPEVKNEAPVGLLASNTATQLAQLLIARGIRPRAAGELAEKYPHRIRHHVEVFDFLCKKPGHEIKDPPAYLRRSIEENWFINPPEGFISQAEREEQRREQEQAAKELMQEYEDQKSRIIEDIEALLELPAERQVAPMLDAWEKVERTVNGRAPDPQERARRQALYIRNLPSRDQMVASRLKDLQSKFEQKAQEQGIAVPSFV